MKFAFINDNKVIKVEDTEEELALAVSHHYQHVIPIDGFDPFPEVGWLYENGVMFKYLVPLSPRQIRQALLLMGIDLTMIDGALDSLPEPTRSFAKVSWDYAISFERYDPMVDSVSMLLGWTSGQIDALWELGHQL